MRKSFFYFGVAALLLSGCKSAQSTASKEPVLETLGGKPVYTSEFEYVYNKNNGNAENAYSQASLQEYLDLYTNFKLKVMDAESQGLDTTTAFRLELEGYKQQLAQPYLTEKSVTDKLIREAYDRMKKEVNASHILIGVAPDAEPKDTLVAYNRVVELRRRVLAGEDFAKLAATFSEDPSAKENKGQLGYFTALQMVYPFEDAAYTTPIGQLSNPIRTKFGYHLIKVNDVRAAQGEIKVSHIMVRATPDMPKADSVAAKKKIDEIFTRVGRRENWDRLVSQFSEDVNSSQNGGELPWFGTGRMIPSFEEAALKLNKPGEIAKPVHTPYGWHIIKLIERRGLPPYEEMETSLRNRVAKDSRSELNKTAFLKRIKVENNFLEISTAKQYVLAKADSNLLKGTWKNQYPEKEINTPLFTIKSKPYRVKDFFAYAEQNQKPRTKASPTHAMQLMYDNYVEKSLLDYEKENLENKHLDYKMLVREYRDGILLFQLMDEKVWSKAISDTVGLQTFFQNNRENYKWDTRAEAVILSAANKNLLTQAQEMMKTGKFEVKKNRPAPILFASNSSQLTAKTSAQLDELAARLTTDPTLTLVLTGQTDSKEAVRKNNTLAQQRAAEVQSYLVRKGVAPAQVTINTNAAKAGTRSVRLDLFSSDVKTLEQTFNETNPLALQVTSRRFLKGENKILDEITWQEGTQLIEKEGRAYLIQITKILPPGLKNLNETRGIATSDYQNYLEKQWVTELRQRFPVKVNQAELDKLVKK